MTVHSPDLARLGRELGSLYASSPRGDKLTTLHLFGIEHAGEMAELTNRDLEELALVAGLTPSLATELRKMIKLARHVMPRESTRSLDQRLPGGSVFANLAKPMPADFGFDREEANTRR